MWLQILEGVKTNDFNLLEYVISDHYKCTTDTPIITAEWLGYIIGNRLYIKNELSEQENKEIQQVIDYGLTCSYLDNTAFYDWMRWELSKYGDNTEPFSTKYNLTKFVHFRNNPIQATVIPGTNLWFQLGGHENLEFPTF